MLRRTCARLRAIRWLTRWLTRWPVGGWEAGALPIVPTHGRPSTFLKLIDLARRLAEPSKHGGDASDAFTVVVPSLPRYAFSPPRPALIRRVERVEVPTAVAVFPADLTQPPRSWAGRTYNITRYASMPRGGHFAAHEESGQSGLLAD
ncbi:MULTISPECIES: hypothetical protein [Streptomyces violaceoruber group]|uniref:Alpha/beta hydrolase n=1 Tax=Streptomyces rubrogriseus TaxID=194673 RepID=A0ABT4P1G5_9ACTN|nr:MULTISPECIES: hypothetical protein [Streptomyces anthocyanicus group]MCW8116151.1 hypothetical protein [Streptomyces anthocyanicus]MCZ4634216.1 hypothetical protein [Streptomyces rubrogriseus]